MKIQSIAKIATLGALLSVAAMSFAASNSSGFVALPAAKTATLPHSIMLAYPFTARIDNNTANQIAWSAGSSLNWIGADDTQLVANTHTPPPAYADIYLYDQYGTYITDIQVPNRACVDVNSPSPSGIYVTDNCLQ